MARSGCVDGVLCYGIVLRVLLYSVMNKFERAVAAAKRRMKLACDSLLEKRKALHNHCTHPLEYRVDTKQDCDDGYGKWWIRVGEQCLLCGKVKRYKSDDMWHVSEYYL